ncbi:MAG: VWA domain-containing protein, partial [Myxococcales bacterium]|nr:VWA domain-containing protein [Myxococcales bacterium]
MPTRIGVAWAAVGAAVIAVALPVARAQSLAADRLEATMLVANSRPEQSRIPLAEERLHVAIDGQHATTTMLQVYENQSESQIEGRYTLRPGSGSHVEGFAYWNGEQKIVGEVFERQAARRVYENVTVRRRDPGLLEEAGEGAFKFKIFPINAREKKRVEIRWSKWLDRRDHTVRYRAPSTRRDAEIVIELAQTVKNLRSPTHKLRVDKVGGGLRVRSDGAIDPRAASSGAARPGEPGLATTGELMLEWDVEEPPWTPSAYVHVGGGSGEESWFALSLAAPAMAAKSVAAKDVTIVIDRSGSMAADSAIEHAKRSAVDMIRLLSDKDRVNVIAFSDEVDPLFASPRPVTADTRQRAIDFVERLRDGGGTDIALALSTAIKLQAQAEAGPRVVVFMTDGQSDARHAIEAAKLDTRDVRLFTLGLGKEVNRPLLQRLAAVKRGTFSYIDSARAIEPEVARLAAHIAKPLLVDVSIDVEGPVASRIYPRSLPDVFAEDELLVTGRLRGKGVAKLTIKGTLEGKPVAFTRTVDLDRAPDRPWVGSLWAQQRVAHLLEEISLGSSAPEMVDEVTNLALV